MTQKEREEIITKAGGSIVNSFKNEHGELFVIFTHKFIKGYMITGDETDWDWLRLHKSGAWAYKDFIFAKGETATIKKVIEIAEKNK